jgi:hypothetical protein
MDFLTITDLAGRIRATLVDEAGEPKYKQYWTFWLFISVVRRQLPCNVVESVSEAPVGPRCLNPLCIKQCVNAKKASSNC